MTVAGAGRRRTSWRYTGSGYGGSEYELQTFVVEVLQTCGRGDVLWLHIANEGKRSAMTGGLLKRMGMKPGAADFLVVVQGRAYFMELKVRGGRQSPAQRAFEAAALRAGGDYAVAWSPEDAKAILTEWGALRLTSVGDVVAGIAGTKPKERNHATGQSEATRTISGRGGDAASKGADRDK